MLKIPEKIQLMLNTLTKNGYEAYIVGGCVRDSLLGITPSDYDITTSAKPQEIMELFEKAVPTGLQHGTVTVIIDGEPVEITTFRTEGLYLDSRHPQSVKFVTDLREDLSRRDFTVNAMAYNNKSGIVDYYGGIADLENKILRAVGEPEKRFKEDALRILRLFRFASQLEFVIEKNTLNAALKLQNGLENISRERIFTELKKAATGKNPKALSPLILSGGLSFLGITEISDFKTKNPDLALFGLLSVSADPVKVLTELKASKREINFTQKLLTLLNLNPQTKAEIKNALFLTDKDAVNSYFEYTNKSDAVLTEILDNKEPYLISHLALTGEDLKELGFESKKIGEALETLRKAVVLHPKLNNKKKLTEYINLNIH